MFGVHEWIHRGLPVASRIPQGLPMVSKFKKDSPVFTGGFQDFSGFADEIQSVLQRIGENLLYENMPELYQPNVHLSVRLPFESTIVSSCQYNSNVLTIRGCNFSCCRCFER